MIFDDWEVTITNEESFQNIPGDEKAGKQKVVTYKFRYIPQDYIIIRTVQYIKPHSEEATELYLENFTRDLKKAFIDPLFN